MGVKTHKPYTPTMRYQITPDFAEVTTTTPERRLLSPMKKTGGRNAHGHITSRFMGGGHKQMYRHIDFYRRDKVGVMANVLTVEYDPNRSSRIALLQYADGERRYILWPEGLAVGDTISAGEDAEVKAGNAMPLRRIPPGQMIHNLEIQKNRDVAGERIDVLELEARELAHDPRVRPGLLRSVGERPADVSGDLGGTTVRAENRAEQLGRRRLPVRPRHADQTRPRRE